MTTRKPDLGTFALVATAVALSADAVSFFMVVGPARIALAIAGLLIACFGVFLAYLNLRSDH